MVSLNYPLSESLKSFEKVHGFILYESVYGRVQATQFGLCTDTGEFYRNLLGRQ